MDVQKFVCNVPSAENPEVSKKEKKRKKKIDIYSYFLTPSHFFKAWIMTLPPSRNIYLSQFVTLI